MHSMLSHFQSTVEPGSHALHAVSGNLESQWCQAHAAASKGSTAMLPSSTAAVLALWSHAPHTNLQPLRLTSVRALDRSFLEQGQQERLSKQAAHKPAREPKAPQAL
jgi:hypothetical protein